MRSRVTTALYQTAARTWLTLAALSFLLPVRWRLGLWLPLHLTLAGAVSTAISGAMQNFMLSLTASPDPPDRMVRAQFGLVTAGAAAIAIGMPTTTPWLTGLGGAAFVGAMSLVGWMLWRAWHRALNVRHAVPLFAYGCAIGFVVLGATLGALMGSRAVSGLFYVQLRHAHLAANVLGWASLTVVGTLITLLPTALRVRMPQRRERVVIGLLVAGVGLQVTGWLADSTPVLAAGGVAFAAGAIGFIGFVAAVVRSERRWAVPAAAFHMLAAFAWFVVGSVGLAVALVHGAAGADRYREVFLTAFVGGWLVQVLLGAWSYLLPMARPGHPDRPPPLALGVRARGADPGRAAERRACCCSRGAAPGGSVPGSAGSVPSSRSPAAGSHSRRRGCSRQPTGPSPRTGPAPSGANDERLAPGHLGDPEVVHQPAHPAFDLISDRADLLRRTARGVVEAPVEVPDPREDRTGVPAAHRDDGVGRLHDLVGPSQRHPAADVDPGLGHHLNRRGVHLAARVRAAGEDLRLRLPRGVGASRRPSGIDRRCAHTGTRLSGPHGLRRRRMPSRA